MRHGVSREDALADALDPDKKTAQIDKAKRLGELYERILSPHFGERTVQERLDETRCVLQLNPSFYTAWNRRREALSQLPAITRDVCEQELTLTEQLARIDPKCYWLWHHRLWALSVHPEADWERELQLCQALHDKDSRNFHGWDYRRALVLQGASSPSAEWDYTTRMIERNFSNASAWHYRSALFEKRLACTDPLHMLESELDLVLGAAYTDPNDQSAWMYLKWMIRQPLASAYSNGNPILMTCDANSWHAAPIDSAVSKAVLDRAYSSCCELIEIEPTAAAPRKALLELLRARGAFDDMPRHCEALCAIDPTRAALYRELASTYQ